MVAIALLSLANFVQICIRFRGSLPHSKSPPGWTLSLRRDNLSWSHPTSALPLAWSQYSRPGQTIPARKVRGDSGLGPLQPLLKLREDSLSIAPIVPGQSRFAQCLAPCHLRGFAVRLYSYCQYIAEDSPASARLPRLVMLRSSQLFGLDVHGMPLACSSKNTSEILRLPLCILLHNGRIPCQFSCSCPYLLLSFEGVACYVLALLSACNHGHNTAPSIAR